MIEDNQDHSGCLKSYLENDLGHQVALCDNGKAALVLFKRNPFPMVLSDIRMPEIDGIELLQKLKCLPGGRRTNIVLMTGYGDMNSAIAALRANAYDYLLKPIDLVRLNAAINRIAEHQLLLEENYELSRHFEEKVSDATQQVQVKLRDLQKAYVEVAGIGRVGVFSKAMKKVVDLAMRFHQDRSVPVLIEGETGTGKEIVARLVHYGQGDVTTPFMPINLSAISPNLFESELFGYDIGAFTGAKRTGQIGKLELAQRGTLFLDEIGDMPLEFQPKLLRLLEERKFFRVGGLKRIALDIRIICATNRKLANLVRAGTFRQDLFYRLNVARIQIPPLRERPEAIAPLAQMFLEQYARQKKRRFRSIQAQAVKILKDYLWPGNVRELQNTIERVVLIYDDVELLPEHLMFLTTENGDTFTPQGSQVNLNSIILPPYGLSLKSFEKKIIQQALLKFKGNKSRTADYLDISRAALQRKIRKFVEPSAL